MALVFLATMTVAGGAFIASKVIQSRPGGARLYLQRKNIQIAHKMGLMDDLQAASAYNELRKHYDKLVKAKPLVLTYKPPEQTQVRQLYYQGSFKSEMTRHEARLVLGVTESESKDAKMITKKWRSMMLKNHPDTGGSPFVAAKINEAKEIVLGEKPAKEGGEEEDDEDGSSGLNEDETPEETAKRKAEEHRKRSMMFDPKAADPRPVNPDDGDLSQHPAPPYFSWRMDPPAEAPAKASTRTNFFLKEDIFHRKATRSKPHFKAYDDPNIWPDEPWKAQYLKDIKELENQEETEKREEVKWVEDLPTDHAPTDLRMPAGHWEDHEGNQVEHPNTTIFERKWDQRNREFNTHRDLHEQRYRTSEASRIRRMAETQARARYEAQRKRSPNSGKM